MSGVGPAIKAAVARGQAHAKTCPRKLRVRVMTVWGDDASGLTMAATIAAKDQTELQMGTVAETIPWEDLDARCGELVGIVDRLVAEVEHRFGLRAAAA